jgi:hypothetical protein
MPNYLIMPIHFEQQRKRNAFLVTLGCAIVLLLIFFWLKWPIPTLPEPVTVEYIEVNLGNSDIGSGNSQPQIPGPPAQGGQQAAAASAPSSQEAAAVRTDDNSDAAPIRNPTTSNPKATTVDANTRNNNPVRPTPAPPAPRAVFNGVKNGTAPGPGGNGADTYKPGTGQGPGNGPGDAGTPGGSSNGKVYRNDRQVVKEYYFQSDLPPATVKAELSIDKNGKATLRQITNGQMAKYRNEILKYLQIMSFSKSDHESIIVYTFNFRTSGG